MKEYDSAEETPVPAQPPAPDQPAPGENPSQGPPPPSFPPSPGETPRAYSAFMAYFNLGHGRSLGALAAQLDEPLSTIKKWSSRFHWHHRILSFNSGVLQQHAEAEAALRARQAADWAQRTNRHRELEWETAQKLLGAVRCFLDSFGDQQVEKMTLGQVSRALQVSSHLARQALAGTNVPDGPVLVPLQAELAAALKKAYAKPPATSEPAAIPQPSPVTTNN